MSSIIITTDLRSQFGPARDQEQRPTCLAFATSDSHAALRRPWAPLSCEYLFYHAQKRAARKANEGATLPAMLEALRHDGQPFEQDWAYLVRLPSDLAQWKPPQMISELFKRAGEKRTNAIDMIIKELDSSNPVMILLNLSTSFHFINANGILDQVPNEQPQYCGRHAVIAVGHGEFNKQRVILIRNSWGSTWGIDGHAWLTERFLQPRIFNTAVLKEDLNVPTHSAAA